LKDPFLEDLVKLRGWSPADSVLAYSLIQTSKVAIKKQTMEEVVMAKGGMIVGSPKEITMTLPTGDKVRVPNTPIPSSGETDRWEYIDPVTGLVADIVQVDGDKWVPKKCDAWKVFPSLNLTGLRKVATVLCVILNSTDEWKGKDATERAGTTGIAHMKFIRTAINSISEEQFNYLNTLIVVDMFGVIEKKEGVWVLGEDMDGKEYPRSFWTTKAKKKGDEKLLSSYPEVFLYKGGWVPKVKTVQVDTGLTSSVVLAQQKLIEFAGGDSGPSKLLASGKDFTSMLSENGKKIYFYLSATLAAWARGCVVDIRLISDGDIHYLWSVLSYWRDRISKDSTEFADMQKHDIVDWFNFIPAARNKSLNVAPEIYAVIRTRHREGAVAVCCLKDELKTKVDKNAPPLDHERNSFNVLPADLPAMFIIKCPIYGQAFFLKDGDVVRMMQKGSTKDEKFDRSLYESVKVYSHGSARNFYGVASTLSDLSLMGRTVEKGVSSWTPVKLEQYVTRKAWYARVAKDILEVYAAPFRAVVRYSPICNLLVITKGKLNIKLQDVNGEEGAITVDKVFHRSVEKKPYRIGENVDPSPSSTATPYVPLSSAPIPSQKAYIVKEAEKDSTPKVYVPMAKEKDEPEEEKQQEEGEEEEDQDDGQDGSEEGEVVDLNQ